jgi:hypothetical protein
LAGITGIVTKRCKFAAQVMCADAGFHADQARWEIGEPRFHLATRPLLPEYDGAARIVAHDVEQVLVDIVPKSTRLLNGRRIPIHIWTHTFARDLSDFWREPARRATGEPFAKGRGVSEEGDVNNSEPPTSTRTFLVISFLGETDRLVVELAPGVTVVPKPARQLARSSQVKDAPPGEGCVSVEKPPGKRSH